jgi:DNA repair protein RadC
MGQVLYEQPREKLRAQGVRYLSLVELIQLIIGSGSARVSAAKLSKRVESLLLAGNFQYSSLVGIVGLGDAKACQLLGAVELGRRMAMENSGDRESTELVSKYVGELANIRGHQVVSYWLDGFMKEIDHKSYTLVKNEHYSLIAKRIFTDALTVHARNVYIFIVTKNSTKGPNPQEIGLMGSMYETSRLLGIKLKGIYAVYGPSCQEWGSVL